MPPTKRGALFHNQRSGAADQELADEIREAAGKAGLDYFSLRDEVDIPAEVRKRLGIGQRLFVAAGGDGTVSSVAQALVGTEGTLGVLPVGTWNHFARDLKIPLDWKEAFEIAVSGETREVDVGRLNDRYFLNNISLGLYPEVVRQRERLRPYGKWGAYRRAFVAAMKKYPHVAVVVETPHRLETIRTNVLMISVNAYDLGQPGFMAPRPVLDGGRLAVYWLPPTPKWGLVRVLARYLRGKMDGVTDLRSVQTSQVKVQASKEEVKVGIDGELRRMHPPLTVTVIPRGITVKVEKAERRARPRVSAATIGAR